ncbi:unnamed protein product [Moneuplotes crassus]|uniref:Uncharacterized protein n=1 Tax=Euplotes crassus TaxID=5936 RepID=A0AAD1XIJ2_EUPCR|nr:unnamed protein product [Moneuplotes crassus]
MERKWLGISLNNQDKLMEMLIQAFQKYFKKLSCISNALQDL